eukprot:XP_001710024.1 Hypothetical protein GL50803_32139 [Giardia lamblia ATCC 50803]
MSLYIFCSSAGATPACTSSSCSFEITSMLSSRCLRKFSMLRCAAA